MKRSIVIFSFLLLLFYSAVIRADDAQDIRDLIMKESTSCKKADVAAILSCYAPGVTMYWQFTDDPEDVLVWINGKWLITSAIIVKADLPYVLQTYAPKQ